jgi:hypothetical protein
MRAKVISTGEIVDIIPIYDYDGWVRYYVDNKGTKFKNGLIEALNESTAINDISFERHMRYEFAKAAMQGLLANPIPSIVMISLEDKCSLSIKYADKIVRQLKEMEKKK